MMSIETALALSSVICSTLGQINFKAATRRAFSYSALFCWCCGTACMLAAIVTATAALRTMPLSALVPFAALTYITVPAMAMLVFKERVKPRFWIGTSFIVGGVVLTLWR
jgi:drug/metabolite transporter (DMT)-like permease